MEISGTSKQSKSHVGPPHRWPAVLQTYHKAHLHQRLNPWTDAESSARPVTLAGPPRKQVQSQPSTASVGNSGQGEDNRRGGTAATWAGWPREGVRAIRENWQKAVLYFTFQPLCVSFFMCFISLQYLLYQLPFLRMKYRENLGYMKLEPGSK